MSIKTETLRIAMMANGDPEYIARMQGHLLAQQASGDIRILMMDDEIATIQFLNPAWARALSGTDGGMA